MLDPEAEDTPTLKLPGLVPS